MYSVTVLVFEPVEGNNNVFILKKEFVRMERIIWVKILIFCNGTRQILITISGFTYLCKCIHFIIIFCEKRGSICSALIFSKKTNLVDFNMKIDI